MSDNFGLKIGVDGEKEFKKALSDINQSFKVLGSEMQLVSSQFDDNDKSVQALSSRNAVLNKEIDAQKGKIETLRAALGNASESFGETDRRTQSWQIQLNKAQAELNKMEREVAGNEKAMASMSDEMGDTSDEEKFKKSLVSIESEFKVLGSEMKLVDSQFGKNEKSVESLSARNTILNKEMETQKSKIDTLRAALEHSASAYGENDERTRDWQIQLNKAQAELNKMEREVDSNAQAIKELNDQQKRGIDATEQLTREISQQEDELTRLKRTYSNAVLEYGKGSNEAKELRNRISQLSKELDENRDKMKDAGNAAEDLGDSLEDVSDGAGKLDSGLSAATVALGNLASAGIQATLGAIQDLGSAIWNLDEATEEYRVAQGKLTTAFEAAGYSGEAAQASYTEFYKILGDTDTAAEASQLLAQLAENEQDISKWTGIAAGVYGTFGDALPIEGMIESANETAKVGQVTGNLADALNWVGISEDAFNEKLAACSSESERNQLIMETLSGAYDEASDAFYRNNEALVASRDGQAQLDETLAGLGETISTVKSNLRAEFLPAVSDVVSAFTDMINGVGGADVAFAEAITGVVDTAITMLPQFVDTGTQMLTSLLSGIIQSLPAVIEGAAQIIVTLAQGIAEAAPKLIPQIVLVVTQIVKTLVEKLPMILDAALQLITGLAQGLLDAIPILIEALPDIITALVDFLLESIPQIIEAAVQLLTSIVDALPDVIEAIVEAIPQIIEGVVTALLQGIPLIINAGLQLLTSLIAALPDIITTIVTALPGLITSIINTLMECIPQIVSTGVQLLTSLVQNLPEIISGILQALPEIINSLITALIDSIPQIIEAGVQLLISLVEDLPNIIHAVVGAIPQIISGLVNAIINSVPQIIEAGVQLLVSLIKNLPTIIVEIVKAVPQIVAGIVDAFSSLMGDIVEIGGNIVRGLWDGITQLADWLWDKVSGWISGIWDGICDFFGIHSPSREMAWVGEMLVKGLSGSIDDNGDQAISAAEEMAGGVLNAFDDLAADMTSAFPDSFDISVNTDSAVSAAEKTAEDINHVFSDLSADITSVLPSSFDINANVAGALTPDTHRVEISAPLFTVQQMIVRSEDDIRRVSQGLYDMIQTGSRAQGLFALT